jgi:Rne/Rng family ribonuclease
MNKELFVSSTPHETKVGMVEDDLLAEVYLERENEYTLAGSIYKGRVTRVLPGMQSAFVDIGLERDAFLYVSDFMELEEHDEDLTDVIPAGRPSQDSRPQQQSHSSQTFAEPVHTQDEASQEFSQAHDSGHEAGQEQEEGSQPEAGVSSTHEASGNADSQNRERGSLRNGRRRRRGGRRDGRSDGRNDIRTDSHDRSSETRDQDTVPRAVRPPAETAPPPPRAPEPVRSRQFGPPAGYEPMLLPGESISKYRGLSRPKVEEASQEPVQQHSHEHTKTESAGFHGAEAVAAPATGFPDHEPVFADADVADAEAHSDVHEEAPPAKDQGDENAFNRHEEIRESASTTTDWNREFHRADNPVVAAAASAPARTFEHEESEPDAAEPEPHHAEAAEQSTPHFAVPGAASGMIEEETIDEDEAETLSYKESSDDSFDEFEEETRAAGQTGPANGERLNNDIREAVSEIHRAALSDTETLQTHEASATGASHAEGEDDSEELELEEAQAEAEALLEAEARGNGTVDARVEVRAPSTAGYTQRAPRPAPGFDRRNPRGRRGGRRFRPQAQDVPKISELLKEGQEILVQIAKEPIGKKGARITSHIALPGRFLVYMPTVNHTGVSRKIASDEERQRLKRIVMSERDNGHGGFIVRTAAQSATEEELRADIRFLKGLWSDIKTRTESSKPPALIYHDLNVVERVLRDQVTSDFSVIWVDTEPEYERILRFFNRFQPALVKRVKLYTKETPLFEQFNLAEEMNKALKSKVWLKSGGYIVINQTEALVAIDINTGKYVGKTARLEDTIVKTNVDAIKEIVRQIRLRDLGGIIIIDFIDMDERRNRQRVMQALEEELRHDRAPSKVLQFNDFGLVAITRKRVKQSLERTIGAPCPYCQSTGYVKSVTTICNEIYVEMRKIAKHLEREDVMLRVNPDIAKELKTANGRLLNEMEELTKRTIIVKSDPALHQEQFDIH